MAKKHLGQNFLVEKNIVKKIVSQIILEKDNIEIGAGHGVLTDLLMVKYPHSTLRIIEKDSDLANQLKTRYANVLCDDCLGCDLSCDVIFSSLPYNISSEFILKLCQFTRYKICYLILQLEFIERMIATRGKKYGALSVIAQLHARLDFKFSISRTCFSPAPQVTSGFIIIHFQQLLSKDFVNFVYKCFQTRRKKFSNTSVGAMIIDKAKDQSIEQISEAIGFSMDLRPDQISPQQYMKMYEYLYQNKG
jgi:16S rRNA (adenine1518-N6/adenine1519-N6)-dimethyltransferase